MRWKALEVAEKECSRPEVITCPVCRGRSGKNPAAQKKNACFLCGGSGQVVQFGIRNAESAADCKICGMRSDEENLNTEGTEKMNNKTEDTYSEMTKTKKGLLF